MKRRAPSTPVCVPADSPAPALEAFAEADLAILARALGHPARIRILRLLLARESCVCGDIVGEMPLAQSTVSQHLKVLKRAGLIHGDIDGPRICYVVDGAVFKRLKVLIASL